VRRQGLGFSTPLTKITKSIMQPFQIKEFTKLQKEGRTLEYMRAEQAERTRATKERISKEKAHAAALKALKAKASRLTTEIRDSATRFSSSYPTVRRRAEVAGVDTQEIEAMAANVGGVMAVLTELPLGSQQVGPLEDVVSKLESLAWVADQAAKAVVQLDQAVKDVEAQRVAAAQRAQAEAMRRQESAAEAEHRRRVEALAAAGESAVAQSRFAFEETRRLRAIIADERAALALDLAKLRTLEQRSA